jgi:hypothetical protein
MALETIAYGIGKDATPPEVEAERRIANSTADLARGIKNDQVERVVYGERTVEVPTIDHRALGRPTDPQYERNKASVVTRLKAIGVSTATVFNFLPWILRSDSLLGPSKVARIMPPKDSEDYGVYVFDAPYIEPGRRGADSPLLATEWHPIQMAQEFSKINVGVFSFMGIPQDAKNPDWLNRKSTEEQHGGLTYGAAMELASQAAIRWMQEQLRHGNERHQLNLPTTLPQKASARRLYHLGAIEALPLWVEIQRDVMIKITKCPNCQKPCEPGAASCTTPNCAYIINPRKAFEIGAIAEDHLSLERLTRAEVTEMGISDYVAETIDEKKFRVEIKGMKPISIAAMRLLDADDQVKANQRREDLLAAMKAFKEGMMGANPVPAEESK